MRGITTTCLAAALFAPGCLDLDSDDGAADELDVVEQALTPVIADMGCGRTRCGENSPHVLTHWFNDLRFSGRGDNGFEIESFLTPWNEQLTFKVVYGRIQGHSLATPGSFYRDDQLIDSVLTVRTPADELVHIRLTALQDVAMWAQAPARARGTARAYQLQWWDGLGPPQWTNVCSDGPLNGEDPMGMNTYYSILVEKDRYDVDDLTVFQNQAYFSIGCVGHTIAKMYLTGHTRSAIQWGLNHPVAERTAMMKAITADYCGIGLPFTVAGTRLHWKDAGGTMAYPAGTSGDLEARWDAAGNAICVEQVRLPGTEADLAATCSVPKCSALHGDVDPDHFMGAYLVTRIPTSPPP
jgi:hypothetical protein